MKDDNYVSPLLGENPTGQVVPLKVSSNGELVVEFVVSGTSTANRNSKVDDNYVTSNQAEYNGLATSLLTDSFGRVIVTGITI